MCASYSSATFFWCVQECGEVGQSNKPYSKQDIFCILTSFTISGAATQSDLRVAAEGGHAVVSPAPGNDQDPSDWTEEVEFS